MEYSQAICLDPRYLAPRRRRRRDAGERRPAEAVAIAEGASVLTGQREPVFLDVLAAAYASAGRFDAAVPTPEKAVDLATASGRGDVAREIEGRLATYRAGRPADHRLVDASRRAAVLRSSKWTTQHRSA
jgi:hypothetical protein